MHDRLKFREVCARWVPRELKDREKMKSRMSLSLQHILRYADEGEHTLNRIFTVDESRVHHYQPESKLASMPWKHPSSPSTKSSKFKVTPTAGKVMLIIVLGLSVSTVSPLSEAWWQCEFRIELRSSVEASGCNSQNFQVNWHDGARPHTARAT
jgi:hypothetical protein